MEVASLPVTNEGRGEWRSTTNIASYNRQQLLDFRVETCDRREQAHGIMVDSDLHVSLTPTLTPLPAPDALVRFSVRETRPAGVVSSEAGAAQEAAITLRR
ncbi:hypothetical protein [Haladaptatus halobius]|uniref:hypothetical protein n=1 Tax=Haladaptatus halobius TaxID=2884875 RepID=UPI001D0B60EE|nr:hypothetical protein [Haladaptatus halobius]